jgi:hypothetical protein
MHTHADAAAVAGGQVSALKERLKEQKATTAVLEEKLFHVETSNRALHVTCAPPPYQYQCIHAALPCHRHAQSQLAVFEEGRNTEHVGDALTLRSELEVANALYLQEVKRLTVSFLDDAKSSLGDDKSSLDDARARWVTLRARWVTLRARWVTLRARWVTLRARWVTQELAG